MSILSIATAQPPSGGIGIGLNCGGRLQTGLIPRSVVLLLTDAEIERLEWTVSAMVRPVGGCEQQFDLEDQQRSVRNLWVVGLRT